MPAPTGPSSRRRPSRFGRVLGVVALALATALVALAPAAPAATSHSANAYHQTNLVSDLPGLAQLTDPDLVNPWGLAAGPTTPVWVADNGTDKATIYPGFVNGSPIQKAPLVVNIPGGAPTGQVFNGTAGFEVHDGAASGPALFLFDSEAGLVTGWNPGVPPPPPSTQAQVGARVRHAIYKGLALATTPAGTLLYAADFHHARIDVFDQGFDRVHLSGRFRDHKLPPGYAPFNVQELGGRLYVAYAKQDADREDELAGPGRGFVDVYSTRGQLLGRLIRRGQLNAPWGLVQAPAAGFGRFSGALLVGNFGDGRINAYDPRTGSFRGRLRHEDGSPIQIEGLWALRFGNGVIGRRNPSPEPYQSTPRPPAKPRALGDGNLWARTDDVGSPVGLRRERPGPRSLLVIRSLIRTRSLDGIQVFRRADISGISGAMGREHQRRAAAS